ncbi:hypothetical protein H6F67_23925 [Microcoleus sp. FACHB-1515]|uniref:hypothetical protein n=1 Tax=Cyanophyceae TaxID=3028117 RepID=UPI0016828D90|nr:hypothetical protein [Microcoleus sp. FACHB-1515]MBD2092902.1 hypothetical protein [Microcoleus sp. FACHB-1515]
MRRSAADELTKRDFLTSLGIWLVIEFACFVLFPRMGLIEPNARLNTWFWISVPLGVIGAFLVAVSSRLLGLADLDDGSDRAKRNSRMRLGQIGGWLGIGGILFPFVMMAYEFFVTASDRVNQS